MQGVDPVVSPLHVLDSLSPMKTPSSPSDPGHPVSTGPRLRAGLAGYSAVALAVWLGAGAGFTDRALGGDWPQWRGPDRADVSRETGLLKAWPEGGPKRVWMYKEAGKGYSGFAVVADEVYTMGTRADQEVVIKLDAKSGKELWTAPVAAVLENQWGDGPRSTPSVDGGMVYALGGRGDLVCLSAKDGKEVWRKSMTSLGGKVPGWGYTESVLVDGPRVIATPGGGEGTLAALDKKTGAVLWRTKEWTDGAQYPSPIAVTHQGRRQYVQLTMQTVAGVDAEDGKVLWKSAFPGRVAVIPTPIFTEGQVYVSAGYGVGCQSVTVGAGNAVTPLYDNKVMKNHHGGVILFEGHLYGHSDGSGWVCQDLKTGAEVWSSKALGKGAVACADGMLYCVDESNGTVVLAEASTKGWTEHGRFKIDPQTTIRARDGRIWTHPVISNGRLFLRDQDLIYCHDIAAK